MLHLRQLVALLIVVSSLSQLTSGQSTVDTELTNDGCYSGGDYTPLLKALLVGQKRLESQLQQQEGIGGSNTICKPQQKEPAVNGILVQQHFGGSLLFNRSWEEFKIGFGNTSGNYWIGNDRLHQLTKDGQYKLRVDLLSQFNGRWYWAEYDGFSVADESTDYTLFVSDYSGNAGDGMTVDGVTNYNINGAKFQTYDHYVQSDCISASHSDKVGGFWYTRHRYCGHAQVNRHLQDFAWKSLPIGTRGWDHVALSKSRMKLLRK